MAGQLRISAGIGGLSECEAQHGAGAKNRDDVGVEAIDTLGELRRSSIDSAFLILRSRIPLRLFLRRERLGWYFLKTEIGLYWNRAF